MASFITDQANVFWQSFLCGFSIWLLYDVFLILRTTWKHGTIMLIVENMIFWLIAAKEIFETFYLYNYGNLRAYAFIGVFLGIWIHNYVLTKPFLWIYRKICGFFKVKVYPKVKKMSKNAKNMLKQVKKSIMINFRSML